MNILVITEDHVKDRYMVEPILAAMLKNIGKPRAKIQVCANPRLRGVAQALDWGRIQEILNQYQGMIDIFLLCIDRDGEPNRKAKLTSLEQKAAEVLPYRKQFFAEHAWQELEVWVLAGQTNLPEAWNWPEIRKEANPKERYFLPFAKQRNLLNEPGDGRKTLAQEAAKHYDRIRQLSPEVAELERRINTRI